MNSNRNIWVIRFNTNSYQIYDYNRKNKQLELIKESNHPENKLRDIDLTSDEPGHYKSSNSARGSYSQPTNPKEIKINNFAHEIANELEHGRTTQAYNQLIMIAAPHINGLIHKCLNNHVKKMVFKNIEKDLMHQSAHELLDVLSQY